MYQRTLLAVAILGFASSIFSLECTTNAACGSSKYCCLNKCSDSPCDQSQCFGNGQCKQQNNQDGVCCKGKCQSFCVEEQKQDFVPSKDLKKPEKRQLGYYNYYYGSYYAYDYYTYSSYLYYSYYSYLNYLSSYYYNSYYYSSYNYYSYYYSYYSSLSAYSSYLSAYYSSLSYASYKSYLSYLSYNSYLSSYYSYLSYLSYTSYKSSYTSTPSSYKSSYKSSYYSAPSSSYNYSSYLSYAFYNLYGYYSYYSSLFKTAYSTSSNAYYSSLMNSLYSYLGSYYYYNSYYYYGTYSTYYGVYYYYASSYNSYYKSTYYYLASAYYGYYYDAINTADKVATGILVAAIVIPIIGCLCIAGGIVACCFFCQGCPAHHWFLKNGKIMKHWRHKQLEKQKHAHIKVSTYPSNPTMGATQVMPMPTYGQPVASPNVFYPPVAEGQYQYHQQTQGQVLNQTVDLNVTTAHLNTNMGGNISVNAGYNPQIQGQIQVEVNEKKAW